MRRRIFTVCIVFVLSLVFFSVPVMAGSYNHFITISEENSGFTGRYRSIEVGNTTADFMVVSVFGFDNAGNVRFMATMLRLNGLENSSRVFEIGYNFEATAFTVWLMQGSEVPNLADPFYDMEYYNVAVKS
jgi:hypothetical protein